MAKPSECVTAKGSCSEPKISCFMVILSPCKTFHRVLERKTFPSVRGDFHGLYLKQFV